jgi:hypothetical protein
MNVPQHMLQAHVVSSPTGTDTITHVPPSQDDKDKKIAPNTWNNFMLSLDQGWKFSYNASLGWCFKPYPT